MSTQENRAQNTEESVETFEHSPEFPEHKTIAKKIDAIVEHATEEHRGLTAAEKLRIQELKKELTIEPAIEKHLEETAEVESFVDDRPQETRRIPWFKRVAAFWGVLGALTASEKSDAKMPEDSLGKNTEKTISIEKPTPAPYELVTNKRDFGHVTLEATRAIPQSDTTKEFFVGHFSTDGKEKDIFGKIIASMKAAGYELATDEMLERMYKENQTSPAFKKYMRETIAPIPTTDQDDTRWDERILTPSKNGTWETHLPEHGVWRTINLAGELGKWEVSHGYDIAFPILFYKKVEKSNTAQYLDGMVKGK